MGDCVEYRLRNMKFSLCVLLALVGAWAAQAELTIVSGNVYDVGKYSKSTDPKLRLGDIYVGPDDSAMCWAAAAANVIQYWQDTYIDCADEGKTVPNGYADDQYYLPAGTGSLQVYDYIFDKWYNNGGNPINVFQWWFQGAYHFPSGMILNQRYYKSGSSLKNDTVESAGFFTDVFGASVYNNVFPSLEGVTFNSARIRYNKDKETPTEESTPTLDYLQDFIKQAFTREGQAVALSMVAENGDAHAITCWGYEEHDGVITDLILSDSDDKKYGTFMVSLSGYTDSETGLTSATLHTNRYNSWYYGKYTIVDATYIDTPEKIRQDPEKRPTITQIDNGTVDTSCTLKDSVNSNESIVIGGGIHKAPIVFVTEADAAISIQGVGVTSSPLMTVEDGAMALLYGGLSIKGNGNNSGGGVTTKGHLYIHGGDVTVTDCQSGNPGAGIYAPPQEITDDYDTDIDGKGLSATSFVEIKGAGAVNISSNKSEFYARDEYTGKYYLSGGAGISAEDSFAILNSGSVQLSSNELTGHNVCGGATFANFDTAIEGNGDVTMNSNKVQSSGFRAYGGAVAGMFLHVNGNEDVSFSGNSVSLTNAEIREVDTSMTIPRYQGGARTGGGAIAAEYFIEGLTYLDPRTMEETYPNITLNLDGNKTVSFNGNSVSSTYNGDHREGPNPTIEPCQAQGGAVYLGNCTTSKGKTVGTLASISKNSGDVLFSMNKATAYSSKIRDDVAQGGAIYVSKESSMSIDSNEGLVAFRENSATAATSQGGGIYNAGELAITNNDVVEFSNNTADEGSHIFNDEGGVAEIAWNGKVLFSGASAEDSTVVNKGTMYLAAGQGKEIQFHNTTLDTTQGTLTVGSDASGNVGNTTLAFTADNTAATPAPRTAVSGLEADLSGLSLSAGNIVAGEGQNVYLNNVAVSTNTDLKVENMTLGTGVQLAETTAGRTLTLSNVDIDLSRASLTSTENDQGGKDYVFDLRGMLSGSVTMLNVTFDADARLGQDIDFINKDRVCMMFGDVTYFPEAMEKTTISMVGSGGVIETYAHTAIDGGNVYFGGYFEVPEPTTGTLSLLALCALSARRRRK